MTQKKAHSDEYSTQNRGSKRSRAVAIWSAFVICFGALSPQGFAQQRIYTLEEITLVGTNRITVERLQDSLALHPGIKLDDNIVMSVREKLLGLGIFQSVLLYMRKGTKKGQARLVVEIEDDKSVLGNWAVGSEIAISSGEPKAQDLGPTAPSFGYRANILARNLLSSGYRASVGADADNRGIVREGHVALGLPRFAAESVQFDGTISFVDVGHRYLNALGFGQKAEAFWTRDSEEASLSYGVSMYLNRERFSVPGFPKTLVGPKVSWIKETRLLGFVPSDGYKYGASMLLPVGKTNRVSLEMIGARTYNLTDSLSGTIETSILSVGSVGFSTRSGLRVDLPVGRSEKTSEFAKAFISYEYGTDYFRDATDMYGDAVTFGIRYHSPGLIAEVAIKLTKIPKDLEPLLTVEDPYE